MIPKRRSVFSLFFLINWISKFNLRNFTDPRKSSHFYSLQQRISASRTLLSVNRLFLFYKGTYLIVLRKSNFKWKTIITIECFCRSSCLRSLHWDVTQWVKLTFCVCKQFCISTVDAQIHTKFKKLAEPCHLAGFSASQHLCILHKQWGIPHQSVSITLKIRDSKGSTECNEH